MRKLFSLFFLLCCVNAFAQSPAGKTYVVKTGETCKKMADGGCVLSYYTCMQFDKDSVSIWDCMIPSCTPQERENHYKNTRARKQYAYTVSKGLVKIKGLGGFLLTATTITGRVERKGESMTFTEGPVPE